MNPGFLILIIIPVAILGAVLAYFSYQAEKKRKQGLLDLAHKLGLNFDPTPDRHHDDEYAHFEVFRRGHSRKAYNTLAGAINIDGKVYNIKMGDFTYKITSGSGKDQRTTTYNFSYMILLMYQLDMPSLLIRKEGMFDKLAGVFGFDDIDFESAEFSRKFYVKSDDKKFAYDVITPRMMSFLLEDCPVTVDIEQRRCLLTDGIKRWEAEKIEMIIEWVNTFYSLWPDHLMDRIELTQ